jgi:hypothetical protein
MTRKMHPKKLVWWLRKLFQSLVYKKETRKMTSVQKLTCTKLVYQKNWLVYHKWKKKFVQETFPRECDFTSGGGKSARYLEHSPS